MQAKIKHILLPHVLQHHDQLNKNLWIPWSQDVVISQSSSVNSNVQTSQNGDAPHQYTSLLSRRRVMMKKESR